MDGRLRALTGLYDLCRSIDQRLVRAEHSLQRTEGRASDQQFLDRCARIDEKLGRTEDALHTVQGAVADIDKTLHELCTNIVKRSGGTEEVLRRMEGFVADRTLHQLASRIDTRLADVTAEVHEIERLVGGVGLLEVSGINGRLVRTEEALRRIERMLEAAGPGPNVAVGHESTPAIRAVWLRMEPAWNAAVLKGRRAVQHLTYGWNRANQMTERVDVRRATVLAGEALLLLGVLFLATLRLDDPGIRLRRASTSGDSQVLPVQAGISAAKAAPLASPQKSANTDAPGASIQLPLRETASDPIAATPKAAPPAAPQRSANAESRALVRPNSSRARRASTQRPVRETATNETAAAQAAPLPQYVGTLEVESKPSGAAVFINGRPVGVTPLTLSQQRAGSLALQVTHKGFQRWSAAVQVRSGRSTEVNATLLPDGP